MTARSLIVAALLLSAAGCAGSRQTERVRAQLDAYEIPRPIAEVWTEALRFVTERGYDVVGDDRKLIGLSEQSLWGKLLSKGHETWISGPRRQAETAVNRQGLQVRLVGIETGSSSCRIELYGLKAADPFRRGEIDAEAREYRDVDLELAFIRSLDADAADRLGRTARAH